MNITCLQESLARGLRVVRRAVPSRAQLPITQNILLSTEDGRLKLSATNLEMSITTWVGSQINETGAIALPARPLLDTISSFDSTRVDIEVTEEPLAATIETVSQLSNGQTTQSKTQINGAPAEDFPPFPDVKQDNSILIEAQVLRNALDRVVFAAATDDARPVLTGVKMEIKDDQATFAAADGFRLSVETAELYKASESEFDALIPSRTFAEILGLLSGSNEIVEISVSESKGEALFRISDQIEIISQLIAGTYPDYPSLIPSSTDTTVKVPVEGMEKLARIAQVFARDGSNIIRLIADAPEDGQSSGKLTVTSDSDEVGSSEGTISVNIEGEPGKIAFNVRYVVDLVNHASGGVSSREDADDAEDEDSAEESQIILSITTPSSPAVFRLSDHTGFSHVVMPMYVQW